MSARVGWPGGVGWLAGRAGGPTDRLAAPTSSSKSQHAPISFSANSCPVLLSLAKCTVELQPAPNLANTSRFSQLTAPWMCSLSPRTMPAPDGDVSRGAPGLTSQHLNKCGS